MDTVRISRADERDANKHVAMDLLDALDTQGQREALRYLHELVIKRRPHRLQPLSPEDLDRLNCVYTMRPTGEVPPFFAEYPELVPILIEGRQSMAAGFGDDVRAILELITYPEGDEVLFVHIETDLSEEEIERRVGRFWRTPDSRQSQAIFLFDVKPRDTHPVRLLLE